jgi:hypothetical protein
MNEASVRNQNAAKDFISGGWTLNDIAFEAAKHICRDIEIGGSFAYDRWKAPIDLPGQQTAVETTIRVKWFPERKIVFYAKS